MSRRRKLETQDTKEGVYYQPQPEIALINLQNQIAQKTFFLIDLIIKIFETLKRITPKEEAVICSDYVHKKISISTVKLETREIRENRYSEIWKEAD